MLLVMDAALPAALKTFAEREFVGERMIWAAQPDRRIHALISFGIWLFAIPWTAFSLFWISVPVAALYEAYAGVDIGAPKGAPGLMMWAFAIFGIPFVLIGLGMMAAPLFTLLKGRRTLYVLTDRRLAVLEGGRTVSIASITPREIGGLSRKEGPDGRGTLTIFHGYAQDSDGDRIEKKTELGVIPDVRRIEGLVRDLKEKGVA